MDDGAWILITKPIQLIYMNEYKVKPSLHNIMTTPSWINEPPKDNSISTLRKNHKKNNKLIKKRFDVFINMENKDFGDDVWSVVKEFMIDTKYVKSHMYNSGADLRLNKNPLDRTTFTIGKRINKYIQIAITRTNDNGLLMKPYYRMCKTHMCVRRDGSLMEDTHAFKVGVWTWDWVGQEEYYDDDEILNMKPYQLHYHIPSSFHTTNPLWSEENEEYFNKETKNVETRRVLSRMILNMVMNIPSDVSETETETETDQDDY
tara:strand:+ start:319 stop:1101 length:783 start_codon:yes stop_codon:yes gene_type:complete